MDKKELQKKENEFVGGADTATATNNNEVPEGFTAMNPPAVKDGG